MKLEINDTNYKTYLKKEIFLRLDDEFCTENNIDEKSIIEIKDLKDKSIIFWITEITKKDLKIEIKDCFFDGFYVENSTIGEINIFSVEVSKYKEAKFKLFKTYFDKSVITRIWCHGCKFFNGFIIRKNSQVKKIRFDDSVIDNSFSFINSKSEEIEIESSEFEKCNIEKINFPNEVAFTSIDKINIFRSKILIGITIRDTEFVTINFHKLNLLKSTDTSVFDNQVYITTPDEFKKSEKIDITECNFNSPIIISLHKLTELNSYKSEFSKFRINFWEILNFIFYQNQINDNIYWGFPNHFKIIETFEFNNTIVNGNFDLSDTNFTKKLHLKGDIFNKYPSFFSDNHINKDCDIDFEYSKLNNFVFHEIDFQNVNFKNLDISNAEFKDCTWDSKKHLFYTRNLINDEKISSFQVTNLIDVKSIYSKLKSKFISINDYKTSGYFYISEQEIKRKISKKEKLIAEYCALSFHKFISVYGESLTKPLILMIIFSLLFSFLVLFTGFQDGERVVQYKFCIDIGNFKQTINDFILSILLSFKNIVPFSVNGDFFLQIKNPLSVSQVLELIHKMINLILLGSFSEAFIRYIKK